MRKLVVLLALVVGLIATTALPAGAITGDSVKDFEHPFVGVVAFFDDNGDYDHRCSGSLLTPKVFLTAGHCATDYWGPNITTARVYFQQDALVDPSKTGYPNECASGTQGVTCASSDELYDYDYAPSQEEPPWRDFPDIRDVALVILDQPINIPGEEYGQLAEAGSLDKLANKRGQQETTFTLSGYGLIERNPVHTTVSPERLMANAKLTQLRSALTDGFNINLNGNGKDQGGACNGDSGGPVFYGEYTSNTIVGISAWYLGPRQVCTGNQYHYRTDQQKVIDWIKATVEQSTAKDEAGKIKVVPLN